MYTLEQILELEKLFGSPIYLFREEAFVKNYKDFVRCFDKYYSFFVHYTLKICASA